MLRQGQRFLPSGTYYFEELRVWKVDEMDEASKRIEVIIPEFWVDPKDSRNSMVNGQEMADWNPGKSSVSAYESATPRVYNETLKRNNGTNRKAKWTKQSQVNQEKGPYSRKPVKHTRTDFFPLEILLLLGAVY